MQKTIFAKQRTSKEGNKFYTYFTTLHNTATDTDITVQVKFKEECGMPDGKNCPMNIVFDKGDANFTEKNVTYTDESTGEIKETVRRVMWLSKWTEGEAYVDTSMNDFE